MEKESSRFNNLYKNFILCKEETMRDFIEIKGEGIQDRLDKFGDNSLNCLSIYRALKNTDEFSSELTSQEIGAIESSANRLVFSTKLVNYLKSDKKENFDIAFLFKESIISAESDQWNRVKLIKSGQYSPIGSSFLIIMLMFAVYLVVSKKSGDEVLGSLTRRLSDFNKKLKKDKKVDNI